MKLGSYRELHVWQKSVELASLIYSLTEAFPPDERFAIVSQVKRSVVSIPSNIAEGSRRGTKKDFRHFVLIAFGSGAELETQLEIARNLGFGRKEDYAKALILLDDVMKMLNKLAKSLE